MAKESLAAGRRAGEAMDVKATDLPEPKESQP
jgi:hypothetical protein